MAKQRKKASKKKQRAYSIELESAPTRSSGPDQLEQSTPCWMTQTNGGGSFENVEGHDHYYARNVGLPGFVGNKGPRSQSPLEAQSAVTSLDLAPIKDTTKVPYRSIAHLHITYEDGRTGQGTAFFIGRRTLATAGHNVHHENAGRAKRIEVSPALNEFGAQFGPYYADIAKAPAAWPSGFNPINDYGVLQLAEDFSAAHLGWFGMRRFADNASALLEINVCGYPKGMNYRTQYYQNGRVARWHLDEIEYTFDTVEGMSGAPVYQREGEDRFAVAIHTYGGRVHKGRRIDKEVFDFFEEFL